LGRRFLINRKKNIVENIESVSNLLYSAVGGLITTVIYLYVKQELKQQKTQKFIQELNDKYILKMESAQEVQVNLLEKTLNGLTAVETTLAENKIYLTKEVVEVIQKTNEPLITEIQKALKKFKNG
jgi:ABC-type multidrug transport system fused ATPase/permease subunit